MGRFAGLILLVVGILLALVGLVGSIVALSEPQLPIELFLVVFLVGIGGLFLLFVGYKILRATKPQETGPRVGNYLTDVPESREIEGCPVEILYRKPVAGKNGRPSSLRLRLPLATPTTLQFNRETKFDRFCKGIGLSREHQTGDVDFDDTVYVRGPSYGYADQYLDSESKRAAILGLLDKGFTLVRLTGNDLEAEWTRFDPLTHDYPELIEESAAELLTLADEVPADDPDFASERTDWRMAATVLLWLFALAFAATLTFVFIYSPIRTWDLAQPALELFALAYPLFVVMAGVLLHGASTSHDRWRPLVGVGFVLFGMGSVGTVAALNGMGDESPMVQRDAIITAKWVSTGRRGSQSYHVSVADWARPGQTIDFGVSFHEYGGIVPNRSHLLVTTSSGRLGIEWLKSLRVQ
jgi:hypothetical protein